MNEAGEHAGPIVADQAAVGGDIEGGRRDAEKVRGGQAIEAGKNGTGAVEGRARRWLLPRAPRAPAQFPVHGLDQCASAKEPVQAGNERHIVQMVRQGSVVGREGDVGDAAGTKHTGDFGEAHRWIVDMLEDVVAEDQVEAVVRVGDAVLSADFEIGVAGPDMRGIGAGELDQVGERLDSGDRARVAGIFDRLAAVATAEVQNILAGKITRQCRKNTVEVADVRRLKQCLPESPLRVV